MKQKELRNESIVDNVIEVLGAINSGTKTIVRRTIMLAACAYRQELIESGRTSIIGLGVLSWRVSPTGKAVVSFKCSEYLRKELNSRVKKSDIKQSS